jgi:transcriptional regulator with XRE-family HTH domain
MISFDAPMIARRRVRLALREAREAAQLTQQQVADEMEWSLSKVIRIESGEVSIAPNDLMPLLDYFGVDDGPHVKAMLADARRARSRRRGVWYQEPDLRGHVTEAFRRLIDYEATATTIHCYSIYFMPVPIRTPGYADAVAHLHDGEIAPEEIQARSAAAQHRRRALLEENSDASLDILLDESVLRRPIGGRAIFRDQLRELLRLTVQDRIHLRMIPFSLEAPVTNNGSFDLVSVPGDGTILYRENGLADELIEEPRTVARHLDRFTRVWADALDQTATTRFIRERLARLTP